MWPCVFVDVTFVVAYVLIVTGPGHFGYRFGLVRVCRISDSSGRRVKDPFTTWHMFGLV